ncbi:MAG: hypothetical protein JNL74_13745, partial [Fibrobacteres bacterium]|nr:hypothetical protein [Fibrobacterota bacterium]
MKKNIWIAIPTYWTHPSTTPGEETVIFDHPTPLDENGTIERLFESLEKIEGNFKIVVVAAAAHESINNQVHSKVESLIKRFTSKFDIYLASPSNLGILKKYFPELELNLNSYGNIRNVQLLLPFLCGASLVVGIDDDEIITEKYYLDRVLDTFNTETNNETVGGMAGPYYDKNGEYRIHGAENLKHESNIFIRKNYYMNEALKQYTAPGKV